MAEPVAFEQQNAVLQAPRDSEGYCRQLGLPVHRKVTDIPEVISCWQLSDAERAEVARTGKVFVSMVGMTVPPHYVAAEFPQLEAEQLP